MTAAATSHPFSTRKGREVRGQYLDENPVCEYCNTSYAAQVHHTAPWRSLADPFDPASFMALCAPCHRLMTSHQAKLRRISIHG